MSELTRELIIERLVERRIELVAENGERLLKAIFRSGASGYDGLPINELLAEYEERSLHRVHDDDLNALRALREPMTPAQYVALGGVRCPFCGSSEICGASFEADAGGATQEVGCNDCDASWLDTHTLTGYEKLS